MASGTYASMASISGGVGQKRMGRLDRRAPERDHVRDKAIRPVFAGDFDEFCLHGASFPGVGHRGMGAAVQAYGICAGPDGADGIIYSGTPRIQRSSIDLMSSNGIFVFTTVSSRRVVSTWVTTPVTGT